MAKEAGIKETLNGYRDMLKEFKLIAGEGTAIAIQAKIDLAEEAINQWEESKNRKKTKARTTTGGEKETKVAEAITLEPDVKYLNTALKIIEDIHKSFNLK